MRHIPLSRGNRPTRRTRPAGWVARIPSVPVVLNYCGLPWQRDENSLDVWWSGMRALAACPNVAVKVSELGLADRAWSEADNLGIIRETIEILGPSRALFASNFPVARMRVNYHRCVAAVERALEGFASDDRVAVFAGNAMRIYRIETNESTA
ncbi:MAG: amidohydrolase family protein [Microvirga sp.]